MTTTIKDEGPAVREAVARCARALRRHAEKARRLGMLATGRRIDGFRRTVADGRYRVANLADYVGRMAEFSSTHRGYAGPDSAKRERHDVARRSGHCYQLAAAALGTLHAVLVEAMARRAAPTRSATPRRSAEVVTLAPRASMQEAA